jgi:hypothetical protein
LACRYGSLWHFECQPAAFAIGIALNETESHTDARRRGWDAFKCPQHDPSRACRSSTYPLHDRDILVTACGRLCLHRKRINISKVLAGHKLGINEVDEGIWLASVMHYDLGYFDLEQKTLQPLDNPFGTRLSPIS